MNLRVTAPRLQPKRGLAFLTSIPCYDCVSPAVECDYEVLALAFGRQRQARMEHDVPMDIPTQSHLLLIS